MSASSRFRRIASGLWLLLHALVVAAMPAADALADRGGVVAAHWDDANNHRNCPPQHDPAVCQLCQALVTTSEGPHAPSTIAPTVRAIVASPTNSGIPALAGALQGSPAPRGPPQA